MATKKELDQRLKELEAQEERWENESEAIKEQIDAKRDRRLDTQNEARRDTLAEQIDNLRGERKQIEAELEKNEAKQNKTKAKKQKKASKKNQASKNFTYAEFNCHEGGAVPAYMHEHLRDLCERVLEPLREQFGACHVNSGHRWESYNAKIGGASQSYHVYENRKSQPAADVTFAEGSPSDWAREARELGVGGVGQYSNFLHVDTGPRRDWWG